jgi:hypothetical protein
MNVIDVLRNEYPGDDAWRAFVDVFRSPWADWQEKNLYSKELGDEEIAMVLATSMGARSKDWFNQPCKALGGRVPSDVFENEPLGKIIIRNLVMRMPR